MYNKRTALTVFLQPMDDDEIHNYRCDSCNRTAFQYDGLVIRTLPGDFHKQQMTPTIILCNQRFTTRQGINLRCKYLYSVGIDLEMIDAMRTQLYS